MSTMRRCKTFCRFLNLPTGATIEATLYTTPPGEITVKHRVILILLTITMLVAATHPAHADAKPNILFILADDMDYAALEFMPNVKALLIDQGVSFDHFFANVALSGPSRATILSGQYSHNHGVTLDKPVSAAFG